MVHFVHLEPKEKGGRKMVERSDVPQMSFGPYTLSRLIAGSNPLNGGSHLSTFVNKQMRRYFTDENVLAHLQDCYKQGINAWQSVSGNLHWYRMLKEQNTPIKFISLGHESAKGPEMLGQLISAGAIAIAHHGERTDQAYKNGTLSNVREYCRKLRDSGVMVGVSTHMPAVMEQILEQDWDVDFFMCCVYERHRSRQQLLELLGDIPLPLNEVYLENDPLRMFAMMRRTEKPCLAFKILAAGRLCETQESVEQAFRGTLAQIKTNDGIIIGMYPEFENQVELNLQYLRRYSSLSQPYQKNQQ